MYIHICICHLASSLCMFELFLVVALLLTLLLLVVVVVAFVDYPYLL